MKFHGYRNLADAVQRLCEEANVMREDLRKLKDAAAQFTPAHGGNPKEEGGAQDQTDARDAARWRWLRENGKEMTYDALLEIIEEYGERADAKLDAAILASKGGV